MRQQYYDTWAYPLTSAIFDDVTNWLESNQRALTIIGKWSGNIAADKVKKYLLDEETEPEVLVGETGDAALAEFDSGEKINRAKGSIPASIILNKKYIFDFENYIDRCNNVYYGNNINIRLSPKEIQYEPSPDEILQNMYILGFQIAFAIVHEFIHYVGWIENVLPHSKPYVEREVCFNTESSDDYRVELCQQELFNYKHPYYSHTFFGGRTENIVMHTKYLIMQTGIYYEWKNWFTNFRSKVLKKLGSTMQSTISVKDRFPW